MSNRTILKVQMTIMLWPEEKAMLVALAKKLKTSASELLGLLIREKAERKNNGR